MKLISSLPTLLSATMLVQGTAAFAPRSFHTASTRRFAVNASVPELQQAIAEVRDAASEFGDETAHFANIWIGNMLEGKADGAAAGLLEDCLLDDDSGKCEKFEKALTKLDDLLGVGAGEQY